MSRKSEIVQTLNESAPSRRESMYMGSHQLKIVMAASAKRPGRFITFAFAAVSAAAGTFALAHADEISTAIRNARERQRGATVAAAARAPAPSAGAAAPAAAPATEAKAAVQPAPQAAAAAVAAPEDAEPARFLVTRSGGLVPSARPGETATIERTYEVAVAVGPSDQAGVAEALVQFGRATGRVTDPVAGEFEVSSSLPLPLDPAQRRIGAAITAPGQAEFGVRVDADGHIVEISGLEVARRQAAWRAWDATLSPVFAEALDEEAIRAILDGILVVRQPSDLAAAASTLAAKPAAEEKPAEPKVRVVGAWPSELEK